MSDDKLTQSAESGISTVTSINSNGSTAKRMSEKDERTWAVFCHLGTFSGSFIPFGNIIAPAVIWMMKKDESALIDFHGKESLNFQISAMIYLAISFVSAFACIGYVLFPMVIIFDIVVTIMAAVKANEGEHYEYPLCIRFIK